MNTLRKALLFSLALLLEGCLVGPNYQRPAVPTPSKYKELDGWTVAAPAADQPKGDWWTAFNDPLLDELEPMVSVSNQTVRQDYANYQEALAEVQVARSALFPTIGISGSATKQRGAAGQNGPGTGGVVTAGSLEGNVSWAPDLWGAVRRNIEASKATAQASAATLANATLSEQTALAIAVIELRVTDANIDLLQQTVTAFKESLRVVSNQGTAGTAPPSDVITARTQLENTQSSLIALGVARAQFAHAIAVLAGKNPEDLDIAHSTQVPTLPPLPTGVPSTLLQRRPDIAVAERQMAAANAQIGIAIAAYYPTVSLTGTGGFESKSPSTLIQGPSSLWSLGGSAVELLFDAGRRHALTEEARHAYELNVANYRQTVLQAFQEVEDSLSGLRVLDSESVAQQRAVDSARRSLSLSTNRYKGGVTTYLEVLTAQTTQLANERTAADISTREFAASVQLIKALGGGWDNTKLPTP